jgi:hypothetical protein
VIFQFYEHHLNNGGGIGSAIQSLNKKYSKAPHYLIDYFRGIKRRKERSVFLSEIMELLIRTVDEFIIGVDVANVDIDFVEFMEKYFKKKCTNEILSFLEFGNDDM